MNETMIKMLLKAAGFEPENVKNVMQNFMASVKEMEARQKRIEEKLDLLIGIQAPVIDPAKLQLNGKHI